MYFDLWQNNVENSRHSEVPLGIRVFLRGPLHVVRIGWVVASSAKRTVGNFRNAGFYHVVEIKGYSAIGCGFVSGVDVKTSPRSEIGD